MILLRMGQEPFKKKGFGANGKVRKEANQDQEVKPNWKGKELMEEQSNILPCSLLIAKRKFYIKYKCYRRKTQAFSFHDRIHA